MLWSIYAYFVTTTEAHLCFWPEEHAGRIVSNPIGTGCVCCVATLFTGAHLQTCITSLSTPVRFAKAEHEVTAMKGMILIDLLRILRYFPMLVRTFAFV